MPDRYILENIDFAIHLRFTSHCNKYLFKKLIAFHMISHTFGLMDKCSLNGNSRNTSMYQHTETALQRNGFTLGDTSCML